MRSRSRRTAALWLVAAGGSLLAGSVAAGIWEPVSAPFPHERHEGLFPVCTGCHQAMEDEGDRGAAYPSPEGCVRCHDGVTAAQVSWEGPRPVPTNVRFDHAGHARELAATGDPPQACADCHVDPAGGRMTVVAPRLGTCLGCHAHAAEDHVSDAACETCHVPLAASGLRGGQIAAFPVPPDHDVGAFLDAEHGRSVGETPGRCATCHTQDRCVGCHVDPGLPEIQAVPPAPEGMELPPAVAHYSVPASHTDAERWTRSHGADASREACATCHTQDDCRSCHVLPLSGEILAMPARTEAVAPGVMLTSEPPASHASYFFRVGHGATAAASGAACATCHEERECVSCHDGPADGGYHAAGFVARHQAGSFGRDSDCATCHSTQAFCRSCHVESGVAASGRLGPGYHAGGSIWLLRHGQAARQNLESCASCHAQPDCTQCHGTLGAFKINPHDRGFDARAAWEKNPRACAACHVRNPLVGRQP